MASLLAARGRRRSDVDPSNHVPWPHPRAINVSVRIMLTMSHHNMELSLAGKVAIITGGGSGIGRGVAEMFIAAGAKVISMDLSPNASPVPDKSNDVFAAIAGDVTKLQDCERTVSFAVARFGRLDILVNAAGIAEKARRTINQSVEDWQKTMDVNLLGTYQMSKVAVKQMVETDTHGAVVNLASIAGLGGFRASNAYGVSKAAVAMMTKTMALDLAERSVRVNAVAPGFIVTPMIANLNSTENVSRDAFIQRIPLARFGEVSEVARTILFLCSDWATYITGAVIPVDGGWSAFSGPSNV